MHYENGHVPLPLIFMNGTISSYDVIILFLTNL